MIDTTHLFQHDALIRVIMHYTRVNMLSLDLIVYCMLVRTLLILNISQLFLSVIFMFSRKVKKPADRKFRPTGPFAPVRHEDLPSPVLPATGPLKPIRCDEQVTSNAPKAASLSNRPKVAPISNRPKAASISNHIETAEEENSETDSITVIKRERKFSSSFRFRRSERVAVSQHPVAHDDMSITRDDNDITREIKLRPVNFEREIKNNDKDVTLEIKKLDEDTMLEISICPVNINREIEIKRLDEDTMLEIPICPANFNREIEIKRLDEDTTFEIPICPANFNREIEIKKHAIKELPVRGMLHLARDMVHPARKLISPVSDQLKSRPGMVQPLPDSPMATPIRLERKVR